MLLLLAGKSGFDREWHVANAVVVHDVSIGAVCLNLDTCGNCVVVKDVITIHSCSGSGDRLDVYGHGAVGIFLIIRALGGIVRNVSDGVFTNSEVAHDSGFQLIFRNDDVDSVVIILENLIENRGMIFIGAPDENLVVSHEKGQIFVGDFDCVMLDNS